MDFHQTEYQFFYEDHPYPKVKLHFKKSVFFFKNVLVCLGSNIKIDNGGTATKARRHCCIAQYSNFFAHYNLMT